MKQNICVTRSRTCLLSLSVSKPEGEPYELQSGEEIIFGIKKELSDENYIVLKKIDTQEEDNTFSIILTPDDTSDLPINKYWYDVGLSSGSAYYSIIDTSRFVLEGNVTGPDVE